VIINRIVNDLITLTPCDKTVIHCACCHLPCWETDTRRYNGGLLCCIQLPYNKTGPSSAATVLGANALGLYDENW